MCDAISTMFGALCMLALFAAVVVVPIIALVQFNDLKARLHHLEREVSHLRRQAAATEIVEVVQQFGVTRERVRQIESCVSANSTSSRQTARNVCE